MRGMRYYYGIRTSIHIYINTAPAQICTPLIVSRSLRSLANKIVVDLINFSILYMILCKINIRCYQIFLHRMLMYDLMQDSCKIFHMQALILCKIAIRSYVRSYLPSLSLQCM